MVAKYLNAFCLFFVLIACGAKPKPIPSKPYIFSVIDPTTKELYAGKIREAYQNILGKRGFSGSILVAKNGEILFEDYQGLYDVKSKTPITPTTPFHIASTSKTFTAMAILKLWEEGKIDLEKTVDNYLPGFPYADITVRMLLNHRSGLNNYAYFMVDKQVQAYKVKGKRGRWIKKYRTIKLPVVVKPGLVNNQDMLDFMIKYKPAVVFGANRAFSYSNTNYALLALIIEKLSGKDYPTYLKENIFAPLGMEHSYVFAQKDVARYQPSYYPNNRPYLLEKFDCIYGDKNIYSTVRDLLLWDKALYQGSYISQTTLQLAFLPGSNDRPSIHNYGLGWRMLNQPDQKIIYHNGWWHGNNSVFSRFIKDTATIIVLGNRFNRNIYKAKNIAASFLAGSDTTSVAE
jgi:CubicO group peptidase (beta-lactamase class C family)